VDGRGGRCSGGRHENREGIVKKGWNHVCSFVGLPHPLNKQKGTIGAEKREKTEFESGGGKSLRSVRKTYRYGWASPWEVQVTGCFGGRT